MFQFFPSFLDTDLAKPIAKEPKICQQLLALRTVFQVLPKLLSFLIAVHRASSSNRAQHPVILMPPCRLPPASPHLCLLLLSALIRGSVNLADISLFGMNRASRNVKTPTGINFGGVQPLEIGGLGVDAYTVLLNFTLCVFPPTPQAAESSSAATGIWSPQTRHSTDLREIPSGS
jgi:hypothetical protein